MDGRRFDSLAKSIAHSGSRRNLLRLLGGGGVAAALSRSAPNALASAQETPCVLTFTGNIRSGPSIHQPLFGDATVGEVSGKLTFKLDANGTLVQSRIKMTNGKTLDVSGQAVGPAISLRLMIDDQQAVVAVGAAGRNVSECAGAIGGPMSGPRVGDLGDWRGSLNPASAPTPTPTPTATVAPPISAPTDTPIPPPQPTDTPTEAPTETATAVVCGVCQTSLSVVQSTTPCHPLPDGVSCGTGLICCGGACVDITSDRGNCGACGHACSVVANCVSGVCQRRVTGVEPTVVGATLGCLGSEIVCNGVCVDLTSDSSNCGSCGTMCGTDGTGINLVCSGGQCGCPPGLIPCGGCADPLTSLFNCGGCGNMCAQNQTCANGVCQ